MKLLNKILRKFGLVAIPIKPTTNDLFDICFKWDHAFGINRGTTDEEILQWRKANPFDHELTSKEKYTIMCKAEDAYRCIVENPKL